MVSITDELREYAQIAFDKGSARRARVETITDRIDAAHCKALGETAAAAYAEGAESVPIAVDETAWVRLPVDADGVPIHVGDRLADGEYRFTVCELATFGDGSWSIRNEDGNAWAACDVTHRTPTVEDVLREMLSKYDELRLGPRAFDPFELMAEYAAKLRELGIEANK